VPPNEPDAFDYEKLGKTFDISSALAQETMYINDEGGPVRWDRDQYGAQRRVEETDGERWARVRAWAARQSLLTPDELLPDPSAIPGEPRATITKETER
jgi:hypothetical protein